MYDVSQGASLLPTFSPCLSTVDQMWQYVKYQIFILLICLVTTLVTWIAIIHSIC